MPSGEAVSMHLDLLFRSSVFKTLLLQQTFLPTKIIIVVSCDRGQSPQEFVARILKLKNKKNTCALKFNIVSNGKRKTCNYLTTCKGG